MHTLFQITIPKRSSTCCVKGEKFEAGSDVFSVLIENKERDYFRQDYCSLCWSQKPQEQEQGLQYTFWKTVIEKKMEVEPSSRIEKAFKLFRSLLEDPVGQEQKIYLVTMFLARARCLVLRKEIFEEGQHLQIYEHVRDEAFFTIKALKLEDCSKDVLQDYLNENLFK